MPSSTINTGLCQKVTRLYTPILVIIFQKKAQEVLSKNYGIFFWTKFLEFYQSKSQNWFDQSIYITIPRYTSVCPSVHPVASCHTSNFYSCITNCLYLIKEVWYVLRVKNIHFWSPSDHSSFKQKKIVNLIHLRFWEWFRSNWPQLILPT